MVLFRAHGFAITALAIGYALLLLSAFWRGTRTYVPRRVPVNLHKWLAAP